MILSDKYFRNTLDEIIDMGTWCNTPRTKWGDGTPAYYKSIRQKSFEYDILNGEFPINTLRNTALKGAFYDMDAIYIQQTNLIDKMDLSIRDWWLPFVVDQNGSIGQTYGHTVKRYDLMNKLLKGMVENPESRRHIMNLWQEQQMLEDPKALVPCAYLTEWSIEVGSNVNYVDLTLHQRSMDYLMTSSINPVQYVMLGMMVCNHVTFRTGKIHRLRFFKHNIQDLHIYDRHMRAADILMKTDCGTEQTTLTLNVEPTDFYVHEWDDFTIENRVKRDLTLNLEIAV